MTVPTTTSLVTYQGNGATTTFTFPFIGDSDLTLEVIYTDVDGAITTLPPSTYTLVINATATGALWGIGGSVTYPNSGSPVVPIPVGSYITINRIVPYEQNVSISNQGAFYPQAIEQGLDLLELQIQQIETNEEFAIRAPLSDITPPADLPSATVRANTYLYFDSQGNPSTSTGVPATSSQIGTATDLVFLSGQTSLAVADALAASRHGTLVIDQDWTLTGSQTLNAPTVLFSGGVITLGNFNLTMNQVSVVAGFVRVFNYSGSGVVLGTIRAPGYPVEWWGAYSDNTHGAETRKAVQYACDHTIQSTYLNATIWMLGQSYLFDGTGVTVHSVLMPKIVGSGNSASSTRVFFSPVSEAAAIKFWCTTPGAPCNGGVSGIYFSGNTNTIAVQLRSVSLTNIDIGLASAVKIGVLLHNGAAGEFTESNSIRLTIPTLASTAMMCEMRVDGGGNNSFANNRFLDCLVSVGAGARTLPIIQCDASGWWYGGELNITLNNSAAGAITNLIGNLQSGGAPLWIVEGNIHIETTDAAGVEIADPAHSVVHMGGAVATQGTANTYYTNVIFFETLAMASGGQLIFNGAKQFGQALNFVGNVGGTFQPAIGAQNYATYECLITNPDNTYNASIKFDLVQNTSGPGGTGTIGNSVTVLTIDTHSYGVPVAGHNGSHLATLSNANWIAELMTVMYSVKVN